MYKPPGNKDDIFTNNRAVNLTLNYQLNDINDKIKRTNKQLIYGTNEELWDVIKDQNCQPSHAKVT